MNPIFFVVLGGIGFQIFMLARFMHKAEFDLWVKSKLHFRHGVEQ